MKIFKMIGKWVKALSNLVVKLWNKAEPFLMDVLSEAGKKLLKSSKDLLMAAWDYVEAQGLPTTADKQKAFGDYMSKAAKAEWDEMEGWEKNLIRESIHAIKIKISK